MCRISQIIISLLALSCAVAPFIIAQQPQPPPNRDCLVGSISLNTGTSGSTTLPAGSGDPYWEVISDPDPGTSESRPATVITPNSAWKPAQPNSAWISSYPTADNDQNGKYVFRRCFCLAPNFDTPNLTVSLRADDQATVFLNGVQIVATPISSFQTAAPTTATVMSQTSFKAGQNCLTVEVNNLSSVAMGLNLTGTMTAAGLTVIRPECCDPTGKIQGRKWNDTNGNGLLDNNESGLAGWTISLSNGMTATTDSLGFYNFIGVQPGTVTISETQQPGWQQTFPSGGTYSVNVTANSVITGRNFGNRKASDDLPPCSLCGDFNNSCCLGRDAHGNAIYSFLITLNYQPITATGNCPLTLTTPAGTVLTYSPQTLTPGSNTISGTIAVTGTPPTPFCFKVSCGASGSCTSAVCTRVVAMCDIKR